MQTNLDQYKKELDEKGFAIIEDVFTDSEIAAINKLIETNSEHLRREIKSTDLFAIRKLFIALPDIKNKILNSNIKSVISYFFGTDYFIIKGLYFDKPPLSNWFVAPHQDISVSVTTKTDSPLYKGWTVKDNQFGVQPPLDILERMYTIRIHLDNCTAQNGALHVIPGSHKKGILKSSDANAMRQTEKICEVPKGGIMLMRPLLLHASHKSTAAVNRRVLQIEFCNTELPASVQWAEKELIS